MSKLNVDQKNVKELFTGRTANYLIPDYQRPYAWDEDECQTLWDDIFAFAFPDNNIDLFGSGDDILRAIVTYKNDNESQKI